MQSDYFAVNNSARLKTEAKNRKYAPKITNRIAIPMANPSGKPKEPIVTLNIKAIKRPTISRAKTSMITLVMNKISVTF